MRLAAANPFDVEEIRLCANGRLLRVPRKPRNVRRNSCQSKDKNTRYIRYLYRGVEGVSAASRKFYLIINSLVELLLQVYKYVYLSSRDSRAFAKERLRMLKGRQSFPSLTYLRAVGPRSGKTVRRVSFTRRPCRARSGPTRPPVLISPLSKISLLCIGCVKCRACTASLGSRRHRRLRTENCIFVHFDEVAVGRWLANAVTKSRHDRLVGGYWHWIKRFAGKPPSYPGTAYVPLHSLAHALMAEIALDCGYPASSLKERIYVLSGATGGAPDRCGILIYTATAGAQGTSVWQMNQTVSISGMPPRRPERLYLQIMTALICLWRGRAKKTGPPPGYVM